MDSVASRFEFRAFAQNFGLVEDKIRRAARCERIRESAEVYVLSAASRATNIKIRDGSIDIKVLLRSEKELEQWRPRMQGGFPLSMEEMVGEVFPAFGVSTLELARDSYTLEQFLDELVRPHGGLVPAHVFKRRFGFTVNGCITEIAELLVNGASIRTLAVEAEDPNAVVQTLDILGLQEYENVNYPLALKRIIGMEPPPADSVAAAPG